MSLSDDLARLADLHQRGDLSDDEFARAKARVLAGQDAGVPNAAVQAVNGLRRSRTDRWLGGVCGGLAQTTGVASWAFRLMFVLLVLCAGTGLLAYLLMWLLVPSEPWPAGAPRAA
ncbi:MAG: PspC domain-containing protein [Rubrivivax sp.]